MYTSEWGITCSSPTQTNQSLKFVSICIKFMGCRRLLDKEILKKSKIWKYVESGTHELLQNNIASSKAYGEYLYFDSICFIMFDMIAELVRVVIANALESTFVLSNLEFYSWQLVSIFCISNLIVSIVFWHFSKFGNFYNHFICLYLSIHLHREEFFYPLFQPYVCFPLMHYQPFLKFQLKLYTQYTQEHRYLLHAQSTTSSQIAKQARLQCS